MSTLNSISAALAQYNANLDWDTSVSKARLALYALRYLHVNRTSSLASAGTNLTYAQIETLIAAIEAFLKVADTTQQRTSFTSARSRWA